LFGFVTLGCTSSQQPAAKKPNVITAEAMPLNTTEHVYANAGTPKFWGSRICGLISRAEVDTLFETHATVDPYKDPNVPVDRSIFSYRGDSLKQASRSRCTWDFGSIAVLEGPWYEWGASYEWFDPFPAPSDLPDKETPDNAERLCEPVPNTKTNGWCDRLRIVSINGQDEKLFDHFDDVLPEAFGDDGGGPPPLSEGKKAFVSVAVGTKTIELVITDGAYRDPKKIAAFVELVASRLARLQPSTPTQQNPVVASLNELTEAQLCSLHPDDTIKRLINGEAADQHISVEQDWDSPNHRNFECWHSNNGGSVGLKIQSGERSFRPVDVFEINGRKAVVEFDYEPAGVIHSASGSAILPNKQQLRLEFSPLHVDSEGAKQLVRETLTYAIAQLENIGALLPVVPETIEPAVSAAPSSLVTPETLPRPGTPSFPGEEICGLLTDQDFALASGIPDRPVASSDLHLEGTATNEGASTTCRKHFMTEKPILWAASPRITWSVSSSVSSGSLIAEPSCTTSAGCYRNKATHSIPAVNSFATDLVVFTSVLPDGRYVEMTIESFEYKNLNDLTTLGETLTNRLAAQQFIPVTSALPTVSDQSEARLCALINDATSQYWLGGPATKILLERNRFSKSQLPATDHLSGKVNVSCKKIRNDTSISVETDCLGAGYTSSPIALFDAGKYRVLFNGKDEMAGEIQLNGKTQLCVFVERDHEPMSNTKEQRAVLKTMMTEIAAQLS
jgi:hypothetical protein